MRKYIIIFFLFALIFSACGSSTRTASSAELPVATKLIVGTFKLEGTQQAVTLEEAKKLLPLWQVYSELLTSDTVAQEEIDGLVEQIQETMTSEQTQAINDMGLTQRDMFTVMQEQGGGSTRSQMGNTTNGTSGNNRDFGPPGGGPPGGDFFMGGGPSGQGSSSSRNSTSNSGQNSTSTSTNQDAQSSRLTSRLLETLIAFLEKKAQQ